MPLKENITENPLAATKLPGGGPMPVKGVGGGRPFAGASLFAKTVIELAGVVPVVLVRPIVPIRVVALLATAVKGLRGGLPLDAAGTAGGAANVACRSWFQLLQGGFAVKYQRNIASARKFKKYSIKII